MQVIETMLGSFGSRLTLHFLPRLHQVRLSPLGKYYDRSWDLRLGLQVSGDSGKQEADKVYLLPFCELANSAEEYFKEVEQQLTANSLTFKVRQRKVGLEAIFRFTSPFYPKNEKLSTAPFFYLDFELISWPHDNRGVELVAALQTQEVELQPFEQANCRGAIFNQQYSVIPEHWGGTDINNVFSSTIFTAPLFFGLTRFNQYDQEDLVTLKKDSLETRLQLSPHAPHKAQFILATYMSEKVLEVRGADYRFKYTNFFKNLAEVVGYALHEESFIRQRSALFDSLFLDNSLGKASSDFMAFAFQSYVSNTWWAISQTNSPQDWFSVWEGNCVFHATVDVEYNLAWVYLTLWPELLEKTLTQWRNYIQSSAIGDFMSHDVGVLLGANLQQYPHQMEVEENANIILLTYALWRYSGRETVLQDNIEVVKRLVNYILKSDTTGNGIPNQGVANTIDDASPAVQFGREQTYLAVKTLGACWAAALMLEQTPGWSAKELAATCQARAELINQTLNSEGWLGDHYAVTLDRRTTGLVQPWTGELLPPGELLGWNAYSLYTSNGLLYLLATDPDANYMPPANYGRLKQDLQNSLSHSLIEYGCTHSSYDQSNLWVSQNLWRDIVAGQLNIDLGHLLERYWAFEQMENSQGRGGCFVDTYGSNFLHYYPRGITAIGLWYGLSGMKLDKIAQKLSFSPARVPLRVPLPTFADWENGLIPWVNFKLDCGSLQVEFENQQLLEGLEILAS